jgi:Fe-S cluster assembly ATP-binding protein
MLLEIKNLYVSVKESKKKILKGVNLKIKKGEQHAIMGKNGSGKSTLGYVIMGHPDYKITNGQILFEGNDIAKLKTEERAKLGLFLSFQNPLEIEGISEMNFLRTIKNANSKEKLNIHKIVNELKGYTSDLDLENEFLSRDLNFGFSGGERKKNEILHLKTLKPKLAILDEIDSGLDVDAVKIVGNNIKNLIKNNSLTTLLISHYLKIPKIIGSQKFHIFDDGKIVKSGGIEIAEKVVKSGF